MGLEGEGVTSFENVLSEWIVSNPKFTDQGDIPILSRLQHDTFTLEIANYPGRAIPLQLEDGIGTNFVQMIRSERGGIGGFAIKKK